MARWAVPSWEAWPVGPAYGSSVAAAEARWLYTSFLVPFGRASPPSGSKAVELAYDGSRGRFGVTYRSLRV